MGKTTDKQIQAWTKARKPIAGKSDGGGLTFTMFGAASERQASILVIPIPLRRAGA